jgi:hypothetical protein
MKPDLEIARRSSAIDPADVGAANGPRARPATVATRDWPGRDLWAKISPGDRTDVACTVV